MIDQYNQSFEAKKQGICHTSEECDQMYADITPEIKQPALKMLSVELLPALRHINKLYDEDPEDWYVAYHHAWGMAVRNLLREKGFGEEYFRIHNLDDIYIALVEEALSLGKNAEKI